MSLHSVMVSTCPFHGHSRGSNPLGDANSEIRKLTQVVYESGLLNRRTLIGSVGSNPTASSIYG